MRKDIKITNGKIKLVYDIVLHGGRYKLEGEKGDIIGYKGFPDGQISLGRIIGRILDNSEFSKTQNENCTGYACCVVMSENMTHIMERWIKPEDIVFCYDPNQALFGSKAIVDLHSNFFGMEFKEQNADKLREWSVSGFSHWDDSADNYEEYKKRVGIEFDR